MCIRDSIFCIQEYPNNKEIGDSLRKCLSFLPYYTFSENGSDYLKVAIFSRYPIQNIKPILFNNSNNSAIATDLLVEDKTIRLISAHLQTTNFNQKRIGSIWNTPNSLHKTISKMNVNQRIRASQANLIREEICSSTMPIIFCGEMCIRDSYYIASLQPTALAAIKPWGINRELTV